MMRPPRVGENHYANLSSLIKKSRENKNMTQTALAKELFVSRASICIYENGKSSPPIDTLVKMILILDIDPMAVYNALVDDIQC